MWVRPYVVLNVQTPPSTRGTTFLYEPRARPRASQGPGQGPGQGSGQELRWAGGVTRSVKNFPKFLFLGTRSQSGVSLAGSVWPIWRYRQSGPVGRCRQSGWIPAGLDRRGESNQSDIRQSRGLTIFLADPGSRTKDRRH